MYERMMKLFKNCEVCICNECDRKVIIFTHKKSFFNCYCEDIGDIGSSHENCYKIYCRCEEEEGEEEY
jgi:hypothetical protein